MDLAIARTEHDDTVVLACTGRLDAETGDELARAVTDELRRGLHAIRLDLADVSFLSSAGIRGLFETQRTAKQAGGTCFISAASPVVRKVLDMTRLTPILIIVDPEDRPRLLRALDLGVNDYLMRPVDRQELLARVSTQIRRYRYTERLRTSVRASMEMAITDALTGLYNRRYLETHLAEVITHAVNRGRLVSVLTLDVDFFKSVNDTYGHDAGDRVLQELAGRLRAIIRNSDLACRTGGEEFVVVLPGTDLHTAERVGERVRKMVAAKPFLAAPGCHLSVTISLGVASLLNVDDTPEDLLKRADRALYRAKREGRNRVSLSAA